MREPLLSGLPPFLVLRFGSKAERARRPEPLGYSVGGARKRRDEHPEDGVLRRPGTKWTTIKVTSLI